MAIDASRELSLKLLILVAMKYSLRLWRLSAMPVAVSLLPLQYTGEVSK